MYNEDVTVADELTAPIGHGTLRLVWAGNRVDKLLFVHIPTNTLKKSSKQTIIDIYGHQLALV